MCGRLLVRQTDREDTRSAGGDPLHGLEAGYPMIDMRRRDFVTLLASAAAWPLAARAQQPAMPGVGFLESRSPENDRASILPSPWRSALRPGSIRVSAPAVD